jgi:hypothetical protein
MHADAHKSECNMYCLDCMNGALCSQCLAYHRDHHAIQVSRAHEPKKKKWHLLASDWSGRRRALSLKETAAPAGDPASIGRVLVCCVQAAIQRNGLSFLCTRWGKKQRTK